MTDRERLMSYPAMKKFIAIQKDIKELKNLLVDKGVIFEEPFKSLAAVITMAELVITTRVINNDSDVFEGDLEVLDMFNKTMDIVFWGVGDRFRSPEVKKPELLEPGCFTNVIRASLAEIMEESDVESNIFAEKTYYIACITALGSIYEMATLSQTTEKIMEGAVKLITDLSTLGAKFFEEYLNQS